MATKWIETVTGSLEQKKQYRQYRDRIKALPANYRTAVEAIDRYIMQLGGIADGGTLVEMTRDLIELFEQAAADQTPIRDIVGPDPVEFVETFLANYSEGQWGSKARTRLVAAIDEAAGDGGQA